MSITKEELIWLLKEVGEMPPSGGDLEDGTKSPCGAESETDGSNMTISGSPDHEVEMAHKQLRNTAHQAGELSSLMHGMDEENLPAWVQAKVTTAADYISKVYNYLADHLNGMAFEKGVQDAELANPDGIKGIPAAELYLTAGLDEAREGDYKPALDHANKERDVAVFALQKAAGNATQAAQLCFAAHKMLTGEQYLSHAKDDAIADLMKRAELENK